MEKIQSTIGRMGASKWTPMDRAQVIEALLKLPDCPDRIALEQELESLTAEPETQPAIPFVQISKVYRGNSPQDWGEL